MPVNVIGTSSIIAHSPSGSSSTNIAAIAGGSVAGLILLSVIIGLAAFFLRRHPRDADLLSQQRSTVASHGIGYVPMSPDPRLASAPPNTWMPHGETVPPAGRAAIDSGGPPDRAAALVGAAQWPSSHPSAGPTGRTTSAASSELPSTPGTPLTATSLATRSVALTADPLLQYINTALSATSGVSRGSLASWELRFEDIAIDRLVGEGSWGRVYKGLWNQTDVAVKVLVEGGTVTNATDALNRSTVQSVAANSTLMARLEREASLMTQLHHPNVVQFLGICTFPAAIVTEYCARGNLTAVLHASKSSPERANELSWPRRLGMAADCAKGMIYLHTRSPPVIHRDLKSANSLVTGSWTVKVCDFNLSKIMEDSMRSTSMQAMNPRWLAPEVLEGRPTTCESDVFAFGVILWELMTWELPWGTSNPWGIVGALSRGERLEIPPPRALPGPHSATWPHLLQYIALLKRCWAQDPAARPDFKQIMAELREMDPAATGDAR